MSTIQDVIASNSIEYYDCVAINIDATHNYYLTQAPFDLTLSDGNKYIAAGGLLQITDFIDNANFTIEKLDIQLAGIVSLPTGETVLKTIQELDYMDKPVIIYRAFIDPDYTTGNAPRLVMRDSVTNSEPVLYKGFITNIAAALSESGDSTSAAIQTSSHWLDFDRVSSRYTNTNSQENIHTGDVGMEYAKEIQKEIRWVEA